MSDTAPLKDTYLWRPTDAAWKPLDAKAKRERRPINQVLNDIVIDYFTPKLFDDVQGNRFAQQSIKKVAKRMPTTKKAKTKKPSKS